MPRQIDFAGKSGTVYRYTALEEDRVLPPAGANYVIAKLSGREAQILFAGQTDNLASAPWRHRFEEARKTYGATDILTRLNVRSTVREQEQEDLVGAHKPPMNAPPQEAGEGA